MRKHIYNLYTHAYTYIHMHIHIHIRIVNPNTHNRTQLTHSTHTHSGVTGFLRFFMYGAWFYLGVECITVTGNTIGNVS
ncbi:hypothetical protein EON63_19790 [archaeon]|nr:MAG: hypothetical protein EON63_19790 [archaeon]